MSYNLEKLISETRAKPSGSGYIGHCPCHDDKNPSLSFREENGKVLIHCHSGCHYKVINSWMLESGIISDDRPRKKEKYDPQKLLTTIINESVPISSENAAGKYLISRGIDLSIVGPDLKFHPSVWHSDTKKTHPCFIGIIRRDNEIIGIQRTYLTDDGKKLATNAKKVFGEMKGGYVNV